jgi:hypothetical protein
LSIPSTSKATETSPRSLEEIESFPKAAKRINEGRMKPGRSRVLTETPRKEKIN